MPKIATGREGIQQEMQTSKQKRKRERETGQHENALAQTLTGVREDKWHDRQDARTENRQESAEKREHVGGHA